MQTNTVSKQIEYDCENGRPIFNQANFDKYFEERPKGHQNINDRLRKAIKSRLAHMDVFYWVLSFIPIASWLSKYKVKSHLTADIICGLTMAVFHVPQTFGYTLIVGVPVVNGLYTAMFPMMMYIIFGTSRHNSIGAFAVVCIMTSQVIIKVKGVTEVDEDLAVQIASVCALVIGVYLWIFNALKLGGLTVFLSKQFESGFTAGVSIHIATSQLGALFGFHVEKYSGPFQLIRTYAYFFTHCWTQVHLPTLVYGITSIIIILMVKLLLDPRLVRRTTMQFPIEMVMVVVSILISKQFNLKNYGFAVVDHIPNHLPTPSIPYVDGKILQLLVVDCLSIAVVTITVDIALGRIWAREHGYQIDPNQELLALGASNIFGAFFGCFPVGASVPRSSLQFSTGGKTQLVSVVNCILIAVTIIGLSPVLEGMPTVILAAIIVVSLKKIFLQIVDLKKFWKISKIDAYVWLISFSATVLLSVQLGLICGVIFNLLTLLYRIQNPKIFLLGRIGKTAFYVPLKLYAQANEIPGVKIFHFGGPLHYGNAEFFQNELMKNSGFNKHTRRDSTAKTIEVVGEGNDIVWRPKKQQPAKFIILDFNRVTFIDGTSTDVLKQVVVFYEQAEVDILIAACAPAVYSMLRKANFNEVLSTESFFPTIHDAVLHARQKTGDTKSEESVIIERL